MHVFASIVAFRTVNAVLVATHFFPDEYLQSLEVAFRLVFGRGELTWEWRPEHRVRSLLLPVFLAPSYALLGALGLHKTFLVDVLPRIQLAVTAAAATDYCVWRLARARFGPRIGQVALAVSLFSWYNMYAATRALSNSVETPLLVAAASALQTRRHAIAAFCVASAVLLRPPAAIPAIILMAASVFESSPDRTAHARKTLVMLLIASVFSVLLSILLDAWGAHRLYHTPLLSSRVHFAPLAFLRRNFADGAADFYGTHPWHFYLSVALPILVGSAVVAIYARPTISRVDWGTDGVAIGTIVALSAVGHKEFRFLAPALPFLGIRLARDAVAAATKGKRITLRLSLAAAVNIAVAAFLCRTHKRGVIDVAHWLRNEGTAGRLRSVAILAPCHTVPVYSHIVHNVPIGSLSCDPPFANPPDGRARGSSTDQDAFYANVSRSLGPTWSWHAHWTRAAAVSGALAGSTMRPNNVRADSASHIVLFDALYARHAHTHVLRNYAECARFANGPINETPERTGDVLVLCENV